MSFHSPPFSCLRSPFHPKPCHLKAALPPSSRTLPNTGLVLPRSEGSRPALKCCRFSRMRPGISHSLSTPAQWQMEKSRPTRLSPVTCFSLPLHALISLSPPLLFCVSPLCSRTAKAERVSAHDSGRILYFQMVTGAVYKHSTPLISEKSFTYSPCLLLCFNSILIDPYLSFQGLQYHMNGAQGWVPHIIVFHGHKGH